MQMPFGKLGELNIHQVQNKKTALKMEEKRVKHSEEPRIGDVVFIQLKNNFRVKVAKYDAFVNFQ